MYFFRNTEKNINTLCRILAFFVFCFRPSFVLQAQPHMDYALQMGGQYNDIGNSIVRDNQGNLYVTGIFRGPTDFDPSPGVYTLNSTAGIFDDVFLFKLDANQNLIWAKSFGGTSDDYACSVVIDGNGDLLVYGYFSSTVDFDPGPGVFNMTSSSVNDIFISKFDSAGNFIWAKQIAGSGQTYATQMVIDQTGNLYCTGYIANATDFDPGPGTLIPATSGGWDVFAAKYDNSGNVLWASVMGGPGNDYGNSIAIDNNYNVITTGMFIGTSDFNPGPGTYNLTSVAPTAGEIFVSKLDANGDFLWAKAFIATSYINGTFNEGNHVIADDSNNVYVTGEFKGTVDFNPGPANYNLTALNTEEDAFLGKLDPSGNFIWAISIQGGFIERGHSLAMDTANHIFVSGQQHSDSADYDPTVGVHMEYSTGNPNALFIAKYSNTGSFICVVLVKYGTTKAGDNQQVLVSGNTAYITSAFTNTTDFNPCPPLYNLSDFGLYDAYVASYDFSTCSCTMQSTTAFTNPLCYGDCAGTATVNIQGGSSPYTYTWLATGGNNATANGLCAGSYTCIITDNSGATISETFALTEPSQLTATDAHTNLLCNSVCNGSAQVSVAGGSPGYTYNWSNSQTTASITSLCAGSYSVVVTDNNGCTITDSVTIIQPPAITGSINASPTPCSSNNGSVAVTASGGTGNLSYFWQPGGDTTSAITNLAGGIYSVTITDQNGCTAAFSDTVFSIGAPVVSTVSTTNILCNGDSTGAATVAVSGNGPFTYQWSPSGGTSANASGLPAGPYSVTVTDNAGCTQTQMISITEPNAITTTIVSMNDTCTSSSGYISVSPSGGAGPFTYLWSNSQTTSAINNLSGGTYSVTVTDANGCVFDTASTIVSTVAPALSISAINDVACFGDSTGSATVSATGGVGPYTYSWQPYGGSSAVSSGISAGIYSVVVSSSDGCTSTITVSVTEPPPISAFCGSVDENCNYQDGSVFVQTSGGAGGFTYVWNNASTSDSLIQLSAGTYSVTITDQNGCIETCAVVLNSTGTANADAGADVTIEEGQSTLLSGSGGITYNWQPSDQVGCNFCASTIATPSITTTFVLTVTDSAGCVDVDSVVVTVEIPCDDIFVPNAFSPNGDGQNDVLFVRGTCIQTFSFKVFNRWGELVFESSDQTIGWDGRWRNEACENAVFTYTLTGVLTDGNLLERRGNVSLVK